MAWTGHPYFRSLTADQLRELEESGIRKTFSRGQTIWVRGQDVRFAALILKGFVKMVKSTAMGVNVAMEIFGPGQMFGLVGTLDGKGCPLSAITVNRVEIVEIPKAKVKELLLGNLEVMLEVQARTISRFRDANELKAVLLTGSVERRILAVLANLAESFGVPRDDSVLIDVPITRQDLADMVGSTAETVSRVISNRH